MKRRVFHPVNEFKICMDKISYYFTLLIKN